MEPIRFPHTDLKKILIIEDEGEMCLFLNLALGAKGVQVDHVQSLAAARDYLRNEQPFLVILDNRLPDGLGLDFIHYIKTNHPLVKIIMISGVDRTVADLAVENGANSFLTKPFTRAELQESIRSLLN
jgi:two-component system, OmpR family, response regulator